MTLKLDEIKDRAERAAALAEAATAGPWYAHATDDEYAMNARYVGLRPGDDFLHDDGNGMAVGWSGQEPADKVIAITLLQQPQMARVVEFDENTLFIAASREAVPALAADVLALLAALIAERERCDRFIQVADDRAARVAELEAELATAQDVVQAYTGRRE